MANLLGTTVNGQLNTGNVIDLGYTVNGSISTTAFRGINFHSFSDYQYLIGKRAGAWTQPLDIAFYTGIKYHTHSSYGGHKFYTGGFDSNFALSIGDGDGNVRVSNTLHIGDTSTGLYLEGSRLRVRSTSVDNVVQFATYGMYLPQTGQTAGLYVESPIEARGGLRIGDGASSGTITVGADTSVVANRIVQRDANGYIYANHINFSTPESENPTINSFITSNGDGWSRKSSLAHVRNQLGNYGSWITTDGRAYPRRADGSDMNFYWDGQGGQPTWLWGSSDGQNMYVWNPSNFSVNYATTSGTSSATTQTDFSELSVGGEGVATREYVTSQGYLTSLPSHNHDDRYLVKGGSWYGSGLPGSRWGGFSVSGGEIVFGDGLPNAGQMGVLIDGAYLAGENNGFWSLPSDNSWGGRRGMYWDGTYLNFTANSAVALFSDVLVSSTSNTPLNITGSAHKYLTINPGNGYEAMVRYVGGSGNSWYVGKRTTGQLVGTESFHFYSEAAGATVGGINPSGDMHASGSMRAPIFYDSNNTDYYLDPNGTSVLTSAHFGGGILDNASARILMPGGAYNVNNSSGTGGAIRINLPTATYGVNTMMSMTVHVYEYSTGQSFTVKVGGYNYYTHDWYNVFAYLLNDSGKGGDVPVYFGNDGTRDVIWIGNPDWSWSYPNVFVTDFQSGHSQYSNWKTGWSISFDTAARTNVSASRTAHRQIDTGNIASQSVSYATTSGTSSATTQTNFAELFIENVAVATKDFVTSQGYLTSLPSHNHDDRYYTESESDSRFVNATGDTMTGTLAMHEGAYYGTITFGSTAYWRAGISQRDAGNAELRIWAKGGGAGSIYFATNFDGESGATTLPSDGMALKNNNLGIGSWGVNEFPSHKLHVKGTAYATSDFRAPIFYDSQDTGFYVDPNSESRLYRLNVGGSGHSLENTEAVLKFRNTVNQHNYIVSNASGWNSWSQWIRYAEDYNTWRIGTYDEAPESGTSVWRLAGRNRPGNGELNYIVAGPRGVWGESDRVVLWNPYARYDGGSWNGDGTHYEVITAANIGSQSVSYATSAGNADTVDSLHASSFVRNDATGQYLRAYYQYGSYLTSERPIDLINQMGGSGMRVDFMHPSYAGGGGWNHVITFSGYHAYNMYQLGGYYDGGSATNLYVRSEANHGTTSWTAWRRLLNEVADPYAVNMNQYVRTTDSPTFTEVYANGWFRTTGHQGLYNPTNNAHFYPNNASYGSWRIDGSRNGWHGIHFDSGATLMMNSNESGVHREGYGWQFRWENGTMYCHKNSYGGGTSATVLDSSNWSNFISVPQGLVTGNTSSAELNTSRFNIYNSNFSEGQVSLQMNATDILEYDRMEGLSRLRGGIEGGVELMIDTSGFYFWTTEQMWMPIFCEYVDQVSDIKLKHHIRTIPSALDKVKQLRGVEFLWKRNNQPSIGFIAQEVEEVLPVAVGNANDTKTIDYSKIVPVLTEAIKEQQTLIEQLMARLEALETR